MKKLLLIASILFSIITQAQLPGTLVINPYQNSACVGSTVSITGYLVLANWGCNQVPWAQCGNYDFTITPVTLTDPQSLSPQYFTIDVTSSVAGTINYNLQVSNSYMPENGLPAGSQTTGGNFTVTFVAPTTNPIGSITGAPTVCQSQNNVIYTVPPVSNATSYTWTLPSGATGSSTTNSISVNYGANSVSGNITVKANYNTCNISNIATLPITVIPNLLNSPGIITGNTSVNPPQNQVTYSINAMPNATSYIWSLPNGFVGTSSTNSITVNVAPNAESGNITVRGINNCFQSPISSLLVNINSNYPPYLENIPPLSASVGTPISPIIPINSGSPVFPTGVNTFIGAAKVSHPKGITKDSAGNVYFADSGNHKIKRMSYNSYVKTLEGSVQGYADGIGESQFNDPTGIAVDASGNIYVADSGNHMIRKITPSGIVSTIAGSTQGYTDGQGTTAKFNYPTGIVVDSNGNLFVADSGNNRIRKITPTGTVSTFAGSISGFADGIGVLAQFYTPFGICIDTSSNLYVTDADNNRIRKITPTGLVSTIAGSIQGDIDGTGVSALFNYPTGIDINSSNSLLVTDSNNNKIKKISSLGVVTTIVGPDPVFTQDVQTQLNHPMGITVISTDSLGRSEFYITDFNYNRILYYNPTQDSHVVLKVTCAVEGDFDGFPTDKAYYYYITTKPNERDIYVSTRIIGNCDGYGGQVTCGSSAPSIKKITPLGIISTFAIPSLSSYTSGLSFDTIGNLYISDNDQHRIRKVTPSGTISTFAGSISSGSADGTGISAQFYYPSGNTTDAAGNIYVCDQLNHRIRKITPSSIVTTIAGSTQGYLDGQGTTAKFNSPSGITVDASGNIYVADQGNHRIRKITPTGTVSTFAGSNIGFMDGAGALAKFSAPSDIGIDNLGNLYIADRGNYRIRKITPAGTVTTFAGCGINGSIDGPVATAQFNVNYLIHDKNGSLYFSDFQNESIKRISVGYAISPELPAGLNFDSATGAITGTPSISIPSTTYTITGYNAYGTSTTSIVISINALGLTEFVVDKLKIYPNPSDSVINLSVNNGIILDKVIIVDITGKVILEQTENLSSINVEKLAKGVYLLTAYSGDKKYQEKFIKE